LNVPGTNVLVSAVLVVAFLAAFVLAVWPCVFFKVPPTFALVAMAGWAAGIVLAVVIQTVIHVLVKLIVR